MTNPEQRQHELLAELAALGFCLPGSLQTRQMRCGKPGCRCKADPPQLHGPSRPSSTAPTPTGHAPSTDAPSPNCSPPSNASATSPGSRTTAASTNSSPSCKHSPPRPPRTPKDGTTRDGREHRHDPATRPPGVVISHRSAVHGRDPSSRLDPDSTTHKTGAQRGRPSLNL